MARFTAREIGRIETTYTSELAKLSWTWVMKPDGKVLYRLSHINGRPERNYWRQVYQLTATERRESGLAPSRPTTCSPAWPASAGTISTGITAKSWSVTPRRTAGCRTRAAVSGRPGRGRSGSARTRR